MAIQAKAGTFTASSGWALSSTQNITDPGFQPDLVLFWDLGESLDATAADFNAILGMSDGTNNVCVTCSGRDGVSTTAGARAIRSDACFYRYTSAAGVRGDFTCAMLSNGFQLTVTGTNPRIPQKIPPLIAGEADGPIDAHAVQPFYAGLLARTCGLAITIEQDAERVIVTAR